MSSSVKEQIIYPFIWNPS